MPQVWEAGRRQTIGWRRIGLGVGVTIASLLALASPVLLWQHSIGKPHGQKGLSRQPPYTPCPACNGQGGHYVSERVSLGTVREPCSFCGAMYYEDGKSLIKCSSCDGTGLQWDSKLHLHRMCKTCFGIGRRICPYCGGTGHTTRERFGEQQVWVQCEVCLGSGQASR